MGNGSRLRYIAHAHALPRPFVAVEVVPRHADVGVCEQLLNPLFRPALLPIKVCAERANLMERRRVFVDRKVVESLTV